MTMSVRPVQPSKAFSPITVTELPMTMSVRPVQSSKADFPIYVTESGMTMLVRPVQPEGFKTDFRYRVGDDDARQACATTETSNFRHRVGDDDAGQARAILEGILFNFLCTFGDNSHSVFYFIFCHRSVVDYLYIARFGFFVYLIIL